MTFRLLKFCPRRGNKQKKKFSVDPQTNRILDWGQNSHSGVVGAVHGGIDGG